jgi:hypothetical protein
VTPCAEPDDAVLIELGRVTWAAINLEDVIPTVRQAIGPEPSKLVRAPVSAWIKDGLGVLATWPQSPTRETASKWLRAAHEALQERNNILHSVPATLIHVSSDGAVTTHGEVLDLIPTRKGGSFRRVSLTEEELRRVCQKLADARTGWVDLCDALVHERTLIHKSDP